jgi:signal transduction histidine kinase
MIWNWLRRRPLAGDVALVALLLLLGVGAASRRDHDSALGIGLAIAETLPLLWRRRWPMEVLVATTAVALTMIAADVWLLPFPLAVALYTLASARSGVRTRLAGLAAIAAVALALPLASGLQFGDIAARVVFLAAAFVLGDSARSRRAYIREIEEKADRLEREREAEARRAAAEEQARIARELHDVVAHALSVVIVQAGAADDVFERDPRLAREPIRAIDAAARTALADLRRVLGLLHQDADYTPQPGLAGLDDLVAQVRATGLQVRLEIHGDARRLPAAVDLSAYRIVQEALTNTLKHARAERVRVQIDYGDALTLEVRDDGHGTGNGVAPGKGLIGMRERVALLGGTIETGPARDGGYRVAASIPAGDDG